MGSGIAVNTYDVTTAAKKFHAAAQTVTSADPSGDLAPISAALPGSDSAAAVAGLVTDWKDEFSSWKTRADDQHDKLLQAAGNYQSYEESVQTGMAQQGSQVGNGGNGGG